MNDFTADLRDIKKLERFFKKAPELIKPATANLLTSLAFKTREYDIENISRGMTVRNKKFIESSLRIKKATPGNIDRQQALVYSVVRGKFTGWEEQETGKQIPRPTTTREARGGNKRAVMRPRYRLKTSNKFYKPTQFEGKTLQRKFYFMMRVMGSRGGGEFILSQKIPTKRGALGRGLYSFTGHKITRMQNFDKKMHIRGFRWRNLSIDKLHSRNDIYKLWATSLKHVVQHYK